MFGLGFCLILKSVCIESQLHQVTLTIDDFSLNPELFSFCFAQIFTSEDCKLYLLIQYWVHPSSSDRHGLR